MKDISRMEFRELIRNSRFNDISFYLRIFIIRHHGKEYYEKEYMNNLHIQKC